MESGDGNTFMCRRKAVNRGRDIRITSSGTNADSQEGNVVKRMDVKRRHDNYFLI